MVSLDSKIKETDVADDSGQEKARSRKNVKSGLRIPKPIMTKTITDHNEHYRDFRTIFSLYYM